MNVLVKKNENKDRRKKRIRSVVRGTTSRPRLSVFVSNRHITSQIIDDTKQTTLAYVTTVGAKDIGKNMSDKAAWIGKEISKKAKAAKVSSIVFDRGGRLYYGRVKILADKAREEGLEF